MEEGDDSLTAERIEELLADGALERLGMGARRACYALPGGRLCVKCYRIDAEIAEGRHPERPPFSPVTERVAREIRRNRFDEARNSCCQECRYWHEMMGRLPEELMAVFPSTMRMLRLPSRGWCVVEERVMNADASPVQKFHEAWIRADKATRLVLFEKFAALADALVHHAVRIYDIQNTLVQKASDGTIRLRIADFEPSSRALIAIDHISAGIVRMKLRRRIARYCKLFMIRRPPPAKAPDAPPVNVLCMKWGDYYTADYVNRLYAGVRRNLHRPFRFVCVTDDANGLAPGVETVPFPPDPKVPGTYAPRPWPNIFAKLALFKDGFADLKGPTLFLDIDILVTGPQDSFFD